MMITVRGLRTLIKESIDAFDTALTPAVKAMCSSFGLRDGPIDEIGWRFSNGTALTVQDLQDVPSRYDDVSLLRMGIPAEIVDRMVWLGEPWKFEGWFEENWPHPAGPREHDPDHLQFQS
jgi:hypothetical protein